MLIADSGATKCEWCLVGEQKKTIVTDGISPYFLSANQIIDLLNKDLLPKLKNRPIDKVAFYGTGLSNPSNAKLLRSVLKKVFPKSSIEVQTDLLAAARALCGHDKGIACILGTGSNSCYYNGKKIVKNSPGIGYILGDEGSGAYLGKKVIQYYLYNTFDEELKARFDAQFATSPSAILEQVYKKPLPNRYLASFALFLAENRGHFIVENILEDGLNDFFFNHLTKYSETWNYPVNFIGSVAFGFRDVLKDLCQSYEIELGKVLKKPMPELIAYHQNI